MLRTIATDAPVRPLRRGVGRSAPMPSATPRGSTGAQPNPGWEAAFNREVRPWLRSTGSAGRIFVKETRAHIAGDSRSTKPLNEQRNATAKLARAGSSSAVYVAIVAEGQAVGARERSADES